MLKKTKTKTNKNKQRIKKYIKTKTKTKTKTKKNIIHKQHGASFMNNIAGNFFSQSQEQPNIKTINQPDLITIIYNRNTPKTIVINNTSPNTPYQSSFIQTVPNIQMKDYNNHYLLVIILTGIKPKLLWAIEINSGAKTKSILDYDFPRYKSGIQFKIIFKLYKYHKNIRETFTVANNIMKDRHNAFNDFRNYLTKNNMLNTAFFKEVNIVQDKGQNVSQFLKFLAK